MAVGTAALRSRHQGQFGREVLAGEAVLHGPSQPARDAGSVGGISSAHLLGNGGERQCGVGVDAEPRMVRLQHARFGVDVDQPALRREGEVVAGDLAHRSAYRQKNVGLFQQRGGMPVLDPRRRGQRVVEQDGALAADG